MSAIRIPPTLTGAPIGDIFEKTFKVCKSLTGGQSRGFFFGDDVQITATRKQFPVATKKFAHQPLDPVSGDSTTNFFGYCHPQPWKCNSRGLENGNKVWGVDPGSGLGKFLKLLPLENPVFFFKKGGLGARETGAKIGFYNASRLRPLALRRLMMRRPCLVDILFRNP